MLDKPISRRAFLLGSSAVVTGAMLSSCVAPGGQTGAQPGGGQAAPGEEAITIVFHTRLGSHADWHKQRQPLFEEQYAPLKLQIDEIPADEMITKLYALRASGQLGDVVWTYLNTTLEHVKKDVVIALDDIVAARGFDLTPYWPAIIEVLTIEGSLRGVPNHGHYGTVAFYYNKNLYQESGVPEPNPDWTVEELVEGAKSITKAPDVYGFRAQGGGAEHMPQYLRTFGGDVMNREGTQALLTNEKSIQGLRWLYDLQHTYQVDPCLCGDQVRETFVAGQLGCYNWTTGFVAEFNKITDWKFEWGVTVAPKGPDGIRGSQVSGAAFCVTTTSKHPNEAFNVLEFYSTKEDGIEHVFGGAGSPGTREDVWTSPELNEFNPIFGQIMAAYPDGALPWHYPANARTSEFTSVMDNNLRAIWTEQVGFDEGVELTQELLQEVLDKESL